MAADTRTADTQVPEPRIARATALFGVVLAAILAIGLSLNGFTRGIDEQLRVAREGWFGRPASGQIHIAAIDARSIAALSAWPWPREIQARLVDRLKASGVKTIAFDVDFSAPSNPESDRAFAAALKRAGGDVILPTFRQRAAADGEGFAENLPIAPLRDNAFLASVNVHPDADGVMRQFTYGTVTGGVPRPAMPALLAGAAGRIGETFPVNTSIAPETLPIHSVSDILAGTLPPGLLQGKTVLIGATAIELGDRYAMPRHGVQPGVIIQALAAETLLQGLTGTNRGAAGPILFAILATALIARSRRAQFPLGAAALLSLLFAPVLLEWLRLGSVDVAAAALGLTGGLTVIGIAGALARFEALRLFDAGAGLPNARALRRALALAPPAQLVVMRIRNQDDIAQLIGEDQRAGFIQHIAARIELACGTRAIFSLGDGRLAWAMGGELGQCAEAVEGLAALFSARIAAGGQRVIVAPVFGIAQGSDAKDPAHAELAAARAAALGCRWLTYTAQLADESGRAQQLLADLDEAMAARDLFMVFQPKQTVRSGRIDSVEALVRWTHPVIGPISPDQFVPVFEQSGRMAELTLFIVDRCTETLKRWQDAGLDLAIAINISAPLFGDAGFIAALMARVDALGGAARRIALEITESAVVLEDAPMIAALQDLRAAGIAVAIDDYGTGQSTLSYLKKFPADEIKIDQSFIRNLVNEASDQILVRSTIAMAHELGFKVTAEGVEDGACFEMLRGFGCDVVQGWHVGKGVPAEELESVLHANRASHLRDSGQASDPSFCGKADADGESKASDPLPRRAA